MYRRLALLALASTVAVTSLTACGGKEALTAEDAEAALLTEENFPLEGYTATQNATDESSDSEDDSSFEDFIFMFDDVPDGCKEAGKALDEAELFKKEGPESPKATFKNGEKAAEVTIGGKTDNYDKSMDAVEKFADECGELKGGQYGMKMQVDKLDEKDARGVEMRIGAMGESQTLVMAVTKVGDNLVGVSGEGMAKDDTLKVLEAQKKAVEEK